MNRYWIALSVFLLLLLFFVSFWAVCLRKKNCKLMEEMSQSIQEAEESKVKKNFHDAMLPAQFLAMFRDRATGDIHFREQKSIEAAVLSFNISGFSEWIRMKTAEEIFIFVNGVLGKVVPSVLHQEGEIDRFVDAGLKAFFLKKPERALDAAISICEAMNQGEKAEADFSIGLSYGNVMVGMVGDEKRFGVLTISETTGFTQFLQEKANQYGARILISGSMKKQIPSFEKHYNSRYLGCIWIEAAAASEDLYDVYDGDELESKNAKRKTRILFEKGIDLFQKGRIYDARLHFIEVLKANRMDGAAKEYLYRCNQYLEREADAKAQIYLEVY